MNWSVKNIKKRDKEVVRSLPLLLEGRRSAMKGTPEELKRVKEIHTDTLNDLAWTLKHT